MDSRPEHREVIIVGGGLAGLSAAIEAAETGAKVVIIDKEPKLGGNSAKASSGINGVYTQWQELAKIVDSPELFHQDTLKSGDNLNVHPLVDVLVAKSKEAVDFLTDHSVDLSEVSRCGGHSRARTHRAKPPQSGKAMNIGMEIISKLTANVVSKNENIRQILGARVTALMQDDTGRVTGVKFVKDEGEQVMHGSAVILTTGGYSADREGLLKEYAPEIRNLPTTNGPFATGDGVKIGASIGAKLFDMEKVQVHPTAFVNPSDPNNPTKFLAAEALRAVGGLLLNHEGKRFVNELGRRDTTSEAIFKHCNPLAGSSNPSSYLVLNQKAVEGFGASPIGFYTSKGFFKKYENAADFAAKEKMDLATLEATFTTYNSHKNGQPDEFGKDFFPVQFALDEPLHVGIITPAIHYTMGGLLISPKAEVLNNNDQPIPGLYGAGELSAGIHGQNRLAGNSLLECVVFGRIAGQQASLL